MVVKKSGDFETMSYVFGVISIVMALFQPLAGLIFGIIGLIQSRKQKSDLSNKAKKLNIIGIVLSTILFIITILLTFYFTANGLNSLQNFPVI